jgi:hypothetical protein
VTDDRVGRVLAAAEIPPSKLGPHRGARLADGEHALYVWILRRVATAGRPGPAETRAVAARLGVEPEEALESLSREDLVHVADGEIAVAYPFSGRPTDHRVRFAAGHEVFAMCAIDALGVAPMVREQIEVTSRDPVSGETVQARVAPDGLVDWQPSSAVVVAGAASEACDSFCGCCPVLNFFASAASAQRWLAAHADMCGIVVSMEDAFLAGRAVFGGALPTAV